MRSIKEGNFHDKVVLMRVDFNVPLDEQLNITEDSRIRGALPSIRYIIDNGGAIVLMSHLGRPEKGPKEKYSLKPVQNRLATLLGREVLFVDDCIGEKPQSICANLHAGDVVLLENVRYYKEETKGDEEFAKKLAQLGNTYVNDAFGTAHRAHASTATIAQFFDDKFAGFLMLGEVQNANKVLDNIVKPYCAIMGGAKVADKIGILKNLLDVADTIIIGGGMAFTFLKAMGKEIGKSLLEEDKLEIAKEVIQKAKDKGVALILPEDVVVASAISDTAETQIVSVDAIPADKMGLDIGPKTCQKAREAILKSKTILWNGPMGVFEHQPFAAGTNAIIDAIAEATDKSAYSLVGGGDSVAAIEAVNKAERFSFISTGGGAMLEYLEFKTLPGIEALK